MEIITSKQNAKVQEAKKLLDKKYRDLTGTFLIETKKVVSEALKCGLKPKCFFVQYGKDFDFFEKTNVEIYYLSESVFKEISNVVTPDGIIAIFEKQIFSKKYDGGCFLLLDSLQNPDNFGAIMRSALATNFTQIFVVNCVDEYSPKVIRSSMGNQFKLKIVHINYQDIDTLFNNAKLFVADMKGENIFQIDNFDKNTGIVIGNEGGGISSEIEGLVKHSFSIPMENGIESLNASVSAGIIMYYIYSKNIKK